MLKKKGEVLLTWSMLISKQVISVYKQQVDVTVTCEDPPPTSALRPISSQVVLGQVPSLGPDQTQTAETLSGNKVHKLGLTVNIYSRDGKASRATEEPAANVLL